MPTLASPGVEVFADIWCPFAYVGVTRMLAERDELAPWLPVVVRAWPLEQVNGAPLPAATVAAEAEDLRAQVAPELFAGLDPEHFPTTTVPALGLAAAAYERDAGLGERVSMALRRSLFEDGLDVSDPEVLAEIAAPFDLEVPPPAQAQAAVAADYARGQRRGVKGSPHFFLGATDAFCPSLSISRSGEHLRIALEQGRLHAWLTDALRSLDPSPGSPGRSTGEQVRSTGEQVRSTGEQARSTGEQA